MASTPGVKLSTRFGGLRGMLSGEGAFFIECSGSGELFFNSFGAILEKDVEGSLIVDTGNVVAWEPTLDYELIHPPKGNPMGGPIYVEGAERGDLLEVTIEKIVVDDHGFTNFRPGSGPLGDSYRWRSLRGPYVHIIKHLPGPSGTTCDGEGVLNDKVTWD